MSFFFFNDTATTEIYTLSLHDALPISLFVSELQASHRQHLCDRAHVGLMHRHCTTQVTLVLGGLLGQDVTLEGLTALDGATGTNAKTLLRAALGLHFGHLNAPVVCAREAARNTARTCWPR